MAWSPRTNLSPVAAPNYVPTAPGQSKYYQSPPRRPDPWRATRPGDLPVGVPEGHGFGRQGPDQGYVYKLVGQYHDQVHLAPGEEWADVADAAVLIALKRASIFGRAPVKYDVEVALRVWGLFDPQPDPALVELRREAFAGVGDPHHYLEARHLVDSVPEEALRKTPELVERQYERAWDVQIDTAVLAPPPPVDDEYDLGER